MKMKEVQQVTTCMKHLAVSGLSSISARIKSSGNLTGNRFEMPNVSYTQPLICNSAGHGHNSIDLQGCES